MELLSPYRLQIFMPDDMREALKELAHREKTSLQKFTLKVLLDKLHQCPDYQHLELPIRRQE